MKIGIVDVGGGLRGIYSAGVFDYLMDVGISFGLAIGVSAGSANLAAFLAGQKKRNYKFYTEYATRKQYMGLWNFIFKKSYINMDYIYGTLSNSNGENPLDYLALCKNPTEFLVVATDAITGKAKYFDKNNIYQDNYNILKASASLPFVCRPYKVDGIPYYDGALSDPVPVKKAFLCGCDKVIVILTKPETELRTPDRDQKFAVGIRKKYPFAAKGLCQRAARYNYSVALARKYAKQGKVLIIAPNDTCGMDTLKRNTDAMKRLYKKGYCDAKNIPQFIQK